MGQQVSYLTDSRPPFIDATYQSSLEVAEELEMMLDTLEITDLSVTV